jgi:hypothetical protein
VPPPHAGRPNPRLLLRPPRSSWSGATGWPRWPDLQHETGTVLGGFAKLESVAAGFQWGLRFLSLMMLTLGLMVALLLWWSARGLRAPPGAGYE